MRGRPGAGACAPPPRSSASPICCHFREREEKSGEFEDNVTIRSILVVKLGQAKNVGPKLLAPLSRKA